MHKIILSHGGWTLVIRDNDNLVNEVVKEELKGINEGIYFNDTSGEHYIFDFKCVGVWFECLGVDTVKSIISLNAFK